ncbi:hypothetical protein M0R45_014596 [Rubus argutus]|uniref:beta-galactosidase n=1 Tax=Rubus argutus TaxID=59490 RepID=A0AAW1XPA3_RUBAR
MWTENWTGWFKDWGMQDPHRTAEDLAFAVARFFQLNGTFQNYYMYHGGTNFGRSAGGPYITTSYDYDAPLDEYGNLNQPKWGHLKELHYHIRSMEKILTYGDVTEVEYGNSLSVTIYSYEGNRSCFISNANATSDVIMNFENNMYSVPAWSVTILPDCDTEVYNTAKVNVQRSIMEKVLNEADASGAGEPYDLVWGWRPEHFTHLKKNGSVLHSNLTTNQLLDQKVVTNDTSDYLWYITSLDHNATDPNWSDKEITLRVNTSGHILHAFVNGKHIGTEVGGLHFNPFTLERKIKLKHGKNDLSLLSVTVGLKNYDAYFDEFNVGIHGPVQLIGKYKNGTEVTKDLSKNEWIYKVGLAGEEKGLYQITGHAANFHWPTEKLPTNRMFVWYKTIFKAPLGTDPVVVDLRGLGKGHAWVNGQSIGRYWTSYNADENGCTATCDYRGTYSDKKCLTNCGKPSQRWYHIPRSFLQADNNALVLFEEFGGNPSNVKFQTVTVAKACANAYEGNVLHLSCQGGRVLSNVRFSSFGDPQGTCGGSFMKGECESPTALLYIQKACIGKEQCLLYVSESTLGPTGCRHMNRLAVEVDCS